MLKPKHAVEIGSEEMLSAEYDLFLSALGYETRSTEVSKKLTGTRAFQIALPFPETDLYAYRANKDYYKTNGFTFAQVEGGSILPFLSYFLRENARGGKPFRVCIDISSLTRQRMAEVLERPA